MSKPDIKAFIEEANLHHPTIEFETFDTETAFLDTVVYKGTRFKEKSILDAKTHFKQTETFMHTHFTSCHLPNIKKGFVKGEALRIPYRCAACHTLYFLAQQVCEYFGNNSSWLALCFIQQV